MNPEPSPPGPPAAPAETPPPPAPSRAPRLFAGLVAGNLLGGLLVAVVVAVMRSHSDLRVLVGLPSMLLVPFLMGLASAWVWRPLQLRFGELALQTLFSMVILLTMAVMIFKEGSICLIILSPCLFVGLLAGTLVGRSWFSRRRDRLNLCLAPLAVLAVAIEPALRSPHSGLVTDELLIHAPPARVWPHVLAFRPIPDPPEYWLFRLGLPYPTETTNGGNFVGADRACCFSGNAVFKEKIVVFDPPRLLTFDIVEQPPDPELIGHLDMHRGEFELRDNGDGTTTLIGRTWYSLHVGPAWYFDWWTHDIFRAVHLRVMRHVARLAEGRP